MKIAYSVTLSSIGADQPATAQTTARTQCADMAPVP
jgi:hypothetical protein